MGRIHLLPHEVITKIAAGEVIERPSFAVKELVENAVDAQATTIKIEVEDGGLTKIVVTDNGEGMDSTDILESYKLHTTSKISQSHDIYALHSMGFRGEALASIAAISRLTIQSKPADAVSGTEVIVDEEKLISHKPIGMPQGTNTIVEELFKNVPARKNFLKHQSIEYREILEIVTSLALIHTDISFIFVNNHHVVFSVPQQSFEERVTKLLGDTLTSSMIPLSYAQNALQVQGCITTPQNASKTPKQYLFINKRAVRNYHINEIIKSTYGSLIAPRLFPSFVLSITIPPEYIDVTIHPRKELVAFHRDVAVFGFIQKAISDTLTTHNLTFRDLRWQPKGEKTDVLRRSNDEITHSFAGSVLKQSIVAPFEERELHTENILQIHNLYLLVETQKGYLVLDQHAAHERILYEQLQQTFKTEREKKQQYELPTSVLFDLPLDEASYLKNSLDRFAEMGFQIEEFGETTFKVSAVPTLFKDREIPPLIREIIHDGSSSIDTLTDKMIAFISCRTAVKAGDPLSKEKMIEIIEELFRCKNPYTCPHGRPTHIETSLTDLNKMFKR